MNRLLKRLTRDQTGSVLALAGAGLITLVGAAGLGVDTLQWYLWKRQLQQAVDAGAMAGAHALADQRTYTTAATGALTRNADTVIAVERLTNPPSSGAFAGNQAAVEVIATTSRKLPFSSIFLDSAPVIRARAVATAVGVTRNCILALAQTGVGVNLAGNAQLDLGCGVGANSTAANAISLDGTSYLDASSLSTVGGIDASTNSYPSSTYLQPDWHAQPDPFASRSLQIPTSPASCTRTNYHLTPNRTVTIQPGRYCGGMIIQGNVTMSPGVYIIDRGSFNVMSQAQVTAEGVTIILTGAAASDIGSVSIAGDAVVDMRAPYSDENATFAQILFYQDPRAINQTSTINGGSSITFEGAFYMPSGDLRVAGDSELHSDCLLAVVNRAHFTGSTALGNNCPTDYSQLDTGSRSIRVVE